MRHQNQTRHDAAADLASNRDDDTLDTQNDDQDALALGPTGTDGVIDDPDLARVFKEEQSGHGEQSGRAHAWHELRLRAGEHLDLALADLDANLEDAVFVGEDVIAGAAVQPDANDVREIGRTVGVNYEDSEPLDMREKVGHRDDARWELNPASADDWAQRKHREEREEREQADDKE